MSQKILVVDDQLFMLRLIQHTLEKAGYELIPARNSKEAQAALKQDNPVLIVGDATVVNDGVQSVINEMQHNNPSTSIPVICVSDMPHSSPPDRAANWNNVVLTKPFSPTKLLAEVKRLMPQSEKEVAQ